MNATASHEVLNAEPFLELIRLEEDSESSNLSEGEEHVLARGANVRY